VSEQRRRIAEGMLFTDQYQLTMAQLYWKHGLHERDAQFDYFFRRYPDYGEHRAGYAVFAGMGWLLDWIEDLGFTEDDIAALRSQGRFDEGFLSWLRAEGDFTRLELRSVPEGRVIHANAPAAIVSGPLAMAQILETSLLNHLNYQTLVATKASRVDEAARGNIVLEFGLRRGPDVGANAGARAALIGGADFTSNVGLSTALGLDPKGTHAHSMIQLFIALGDGEIGAFRAYAELYPDDCTLLVDTVDTLHSGIPNAIAVFNELRATGHEPAGVRLDSGDLAYLAVQAAGMLDGAGFEDVAIVLSSDLDELAIWQVLTQIEIEAPRYGVDPRALAARLVYGVGTRLISSHGAPALGGVYKLVAVEDETWQPAIKISDTPEKIPIPGRKRLWRVYDERGLATADVVSALEEDLVALGEITLHHPHRDGVSRTLAGDAIGSVEELLVPVLAGGHRLDGDPSIHQLRLWRRADLDRLDAGVRRIVDPVEYHVSVTTAVRDLQKELVARARR
jgi:nicotinate phosphoribosyltransferase